VLRDAGEDVIAREQRRVPIECTLSDVRIGNGDRELSTITATQLVDVDVDVDLALERHEHLVGSTCTLLSQVLHEVVVSARCGFV
jgi:hypothetical protein